MDPVWTQLGRAWTWEEGGGYFGVPLTNFLGWYLTVFVIYQVFAIWLAKSRTQPQPLRPRIWLLAVFFYGTSAAGNLLVRAPAGIQVVTDSTGAQWTVSAILNTSALVSIFVMGGFTVIAAIRVFDTNPTVSRT